MFILANVFQVQHIFTDKTGTLTENEMTVKEVYHTQLQELTENQIGPLLLNGKFYEESCMSYSEILEILAICNTVVPTSLDPSSLRSANKSDQDTSIVVADFNYEGESPDEVALVTMAAKAGYILKVSPPPLSHLLLTTHESVSFNFNSATQPVVRDPYAIQSRDQNHITIIRRQLAGENSGKESGSSHDPIR